MKKKVLIIMLLVLSFNVLAEVELKKDQFIADIFAVRNYKEKLLSKMQTNMMHQDLLEPIKIVQPLIKGLSPIIVSQLKPAPEPITPKLKEHSKGISPLCKIVSC